MEYSNIVIHIALGVSLSACAGIRAFLPLLVMGILQQLGYLQVTPSFQWIGSTPALVVFGTAAFVEILCDKLPLLDNAIDTLGTFIKPIAGTILFAGVLIGIDPLLALVFGIITGGSVSEIIHLQKASIRGGSTVVTSGIANPILSLAEDVAASIGIVFAYFLPVIFFCFVMISLIIAFRMFNKIIKSLKGGQKEPVL